MEKKYKFTKDLKNFDESRFETEESFNFIREINELTVNKNQDQAFSIIRNYIKEILEKPTKENIENEEPLKLLMISEIPNMKKELIDICLDLMIDIEENELTEEKKKKFFDRIEK
jgi:hypothetical protein